MKSHLVSAQVRETVTNYINIKITAHLQIQSQSVELPQPAVRYFHERQSFRQSLSSTSGFSSSSASGPFPSGLAGIANTAVEMPKMRAIKNFIVVLVVVET
jgi:hypothetical protein